MKLKKNSDNFIYNLYILIASSILQFVRFKTAKNSLRIKMS